jgi:hypothetical protein
MYYIAEISSKVGKGITKTEIFKGNPSALASKLRGLRLVEKLKIISRITFLHTNAYARFKKDLVIGKKYGDVIFTEAMSNLKKVRVLDFVGELVHLNDDFIATVEMLEELPKRALGSTVRIKENLSEGAVIPFGVNRDMKALAGTEQVIVGIKTLTHGLEHVTAYELEGSRWNWGEGMFELEEV